MPFMPHNISAVVLYGKKTCNRLAEILNYWQTILVDHAWDRYLFLCVTEENETWTFPGEGEMTPGAQALLNKQVVRCIHMKIKPDQPKTWKMPAKYLEALQFRLALGHVMVHCVCDDLSAAPPAEAAVSLMKSAVDFLGKGNAHCLYYLLLRQTFQARRQQQELALAIAAQQPDAVTYLLSNIANDGSRLHKFEMRRAAMCEILVASDSKRHYHQPQVYSLGYTSLNANDKELLSLRRNAIANVLREYSRKPIPNPEGWNILTMKTAPQPNEFAEYAIAAAVTNWVSGIADKFVIKPNDRELINLRILAGILNPDDAPGLQDACIRFFDVNMTARTDAAIRAKANHHINSVIAEICKCINAQGFPFVLLGRVMDELKKIEKTTSAPLMIRLPKRKFLQPKEEYLSQCARDVAVQVRNGYVVKAAARVAHCLLEGFQRVEETLKKIQLDDQFVKVIHEYMMFASEEENLRIKYPKYAAAINATIKDGEMHVFGEEWLRSAGKIFTDEFRMDAHVIRALVESGVSALHAHMPGGFNGSFMDALHAELDSEHTMESFLDRFLANSRHMFKCPYITPSTREEDVMYFVDDDLQRMDWVHGKQGRTFMANNDNIEKLAFVRLNRELKWLAEEWQDENLCFSQEHGEELMEDPLDWEGEKAKKNRANADAQTGSAQKQASRENENPRNICLIHQDGRYMLTWTWASGVETVLVSVNGGNARPVANGQYMLNGGVDVTSMITYGENRFLLRCKDLSVYGQVSLCGKQYPVRFRFAPSNRGGVTLKMEGSIPPNAALLLGEQSGEDKLCFYPVAARGLNGDVAYDGLMLSGRYKLMVSPENRFPLVRPVPEPNL